jgi:hypothetical protein
VSRSTAADGIFSDGQRELLRAAQNQLVPSEGAMPGAGDSGGPAVVERFLRQRAELREPVLMALEQLHAAAGGAGFAALPPDAQIAALQAVEQSHPGPFRELVRQTYNAYYTNPDVQQALGHGGPPQPNGFQLESLDEARLEGVKRRGKRWRDA